MRLKIQEKLQLLRKKNGYSQEQLADKLGVSRQTIGKWENGQAFPELSGMILLSELYKVTIDRMVKEDDGCNIPITNQTDMKIGDTVSFLIRAKQKTYAGYGPKVKSSRVEAHDLQYEENDYMYYDTYLGGQCFSGEEAIWVKEKPVWCMNYSGRVIGENFSGDFLKEVLSHVPYYMPYRGPAIYQKGDYSYHCKVNGEFVWFQGDEEIFYNGNKIYECYFHGGIVK